MVILEYAKMVFGAGCARSLVFLMFTGRLKQTDITYDKKFSWLLINMLYSGDDYNECNEPEENCQLHRV